MREFERLFQIDAHVILSFPTHPTLKYLNVHYSDQPQLINRPLLYKTHPQLIRRPFVTQVRKKNAAIGKQSDPLVFLWIPRSG